MNDENPIANLITLIFMAYIVSIGYNILKTGWIIYQHRGFRHFMGNNSENFSGESNSKKWKKAAKAFGVRVRKLKKMSEKEIKDLYRKMAMKHHPDKGGDPDKFRNLHEAYEFASYYAV